MMPEQLVGTFAIADAFLITNRGLVLAGQLIGQVSPGQYLAFADGTRLRITGVNHSNQPNQFGLLVETIITSRVEAAQADYVGAVAQIFAVQ